MTITEPASLSNEPLSEVLKLIKGADTVELKLTVPDVDRRSAVAALEVDVLDAQIRQVVFFDTRDLTLNNMVSSCGPDGCRGRAATPWSNCARSYPSVLPADLRKSPSFTVEVDAMPGGFVCSGSLKAELGRSDVKEALCGQRPVRKLFTKEQRAFFAAHVPAGADLDGLAVLGPIFVLKLKFTPTGYGRRLVDELWLYPDGSRILELSTKCAPADASQVAAETKVFLAEHWVNLVGEQQTKTRTALEFFASELRGAVAKD